ncbi:Aldo/keto reductase [Mrakia frigida]|uniref:aldo/keto reductase n=1 Tax=Mrakia frigida TaxID=29902 RepID=UPI003FCBF6D2
MSDEQTVQSVTWALEAGIRHIDTATWYENEAPCKFAIEQFLSKNDLPRSAVFYTTKLRAPTSYEETIEAIDYSLANAPGGLIDLYLMHSAIGGPELREASWRAMEKGKKDGGLRSIGVSNWGVAHIEEHVVRVADASKPEIVTLPSLNQVDLHPFMTREPLVAKCREHGIHLEAWAPLVRALKFNHPVIQKISKAHSVTPAQVLLRWSLQKGFICIPKSVSQSRIKSNTDLYGFELNESEVQELDALDEYLITDWDVTETP